MAVSFRFFRVSSIHRPTRNPLLSPAAATDQNSPAVLTSHAPWLAPIGHRQQDLDVELDRKLVICRGF
jgi:hypothetical protein